MEVMESMQTIRDNPHLREQVANLRSYYSFLIFQDAERNFLVVEEREKGSKEMIQVRFSGATVERIDLDTNKMDYRLALEEHLRNAGFGQDLQEKLCEEVVSTPTIGKIERTLIRGTVLRTGYYVESPELVGVVEEEDEHFKLVFRSKDLIRNDGTKVLYLAEEKSHYVYKEQGDDDVETLLRPGFLGRTGILTNPFFRETHQGIAGLLDEKKLFVL